MTKKHNIGSIAGGNPIRGREEHDFYATAPEDTHNFINALERDGIFLNGKSINEPCAGAGHIVDVLNERFPDSKVIYSDLISRREDVQGDKDFLTSDYEQTDIWLTNPPFKHAQEFVEKGLEKATDKVIILAKLSFLEGIKRIEFYKNSPLKYVYVYTYRANTLRNGQELNEQGKPWATVLAFAWFVFEKGYEGEPIIRWITRD